MTKADTLPVGSHAHESEFAGRKLLVLSAAIALTTSMNSVMFYSMGTFIGPMQAEFGWDRGSISFALTMMTIGLFLSGPVMGIACDRFGAAKVGTLSLLAYAAAVVIMTLTIGTLPQLWITFFLIAVVGAGSTPIVLVRPITAGFVRQRGLALGIVLTGAGIAGFWVPNLVAIVTAAYGWRAAYQVLAAMAVLVAPLLYFGFRRSARREAQAAGSAPAAIGLTAGEARRTPAFWILAAMTVAMAMGVGGIMVHLVPMFEDWGASATSAARITSLIGIASVVGRLTIGACLDRFPAPLVCCAVFAIGIVGLAMLWLSGLGFAVVAVLLIGLLLGAEIDLIAYLAARQFGQKAYGAIYGLLYSLYAIGYGSGPFLIGRLHDASGTYDSALLVSMMMMALAAVLALGLRKPLVSLG